MSKPAPAPVGPTEPMLLLLEVARLVIDVSMWLVLSRLVLRLVVRREGNPFWQTVVRATEPLYRVVRAITAHRMPERWLDLLSLAGLGLVRIPVALALRAATG